MPAPTALQRAPDALAIEETIHDAPQSAIDQDVLIHTSTQSEPFQESAAQEPEVDDLISFLQDMGAAVERTYPDTIEIEGRKRLRGADHRVLPDRIETGTFVVAAAVTAVPGVVGLHAGMFGEVATYLPGHRVAGIRTSADNVTEVHVTLSYGSPVRDTAARIRDAAAAVTTPIASAAIAPPALPHIAFIRFAPMRSDEVARGIGQHDVAHRLPTMGRGQRSPQRKPDADQFDADQVGGHAATGNHGRH